MFMKIPPDILKSRVAVITGAGQGIGAEIVRGFVEKGYRIALVDYNRDAGLEQERRWEGKGKFYPCDLSNQQEVEALCRSLRDDFEAIDVIIHNARSPAKERDLLQNLENEWDRAIQVMLKHPIMINHLLLESLKKSSNPSILYIGSTNAHFISQQPLSYHVIKGALSQTVRYLACEYGAHKIRVNLLNPGIVDIPGRPKRNPQFFQEVVEAVIPLKRTVLASEIADFCLFFSSEQATYLTGSSLDLDGGEHLQDHFNLMMNQMRNTTCEMAKI